jgi:hypothetical protein
VLALGITAIGCGMQLQADLVEPARKVKGERSVGLPDATVSKTFREAVVHHVTGFGVDPIWRKIEMGGYGIAGLSKHRRKPIELHVRTGLHHGDQVEVLGRALDESEQQQRTSPYADDLYGTSPILQVAAYELKGFAETSLVEQQAHTGSLSARNKNFNFPMGTAPEPEPPLSPVPVHLGDEESLQQRERPL